MSASTSATRSHQGGALQSVSQHQQQPRKSPARPCQDDDAAVGAQLAALFGASGSGVAGYGSFRGSPASAPSRASAAMGSASDLPARVIAPQSPPGRLASSGMQGHLLSAPLVSSSSDLNAVVRQGVERLQREAAEARAIQAQYQYAPLDFTPPPSPSPPPARAPRPSQPMGFLREQDARQERERHALELAKKGSNLKRDERLKLMEELDLKIGPWEFDGSKADFATLEAYSGHNLRSRAISHQDFQDVMVGRYYLSPSLLYSLRNRAVSRFKGSDGDYDLPVEGEWVTIACITSVGPEWTSKREEGDKFDDWLEDDRLDQDGRAQKLKRLQREREERVRLLQEGRNYELQDIGSFARGALGDQDGGKEGHHEMKLMAIKAKGKYDGEDNYYGGTGGTYEKLGRHCVGQVVAIISPKMIIPNKSNDTNKVLLKPMGAKSIIVIGTSKDFAACTAKRSDGEPCGKYVDKRGLYGPRTRAPICEYHLGLGVERTQQGRQEFANSSSAVGVKRTTTPGGHSSRSVQSKFTQKEGRGKSKYSDKFANSEKHQERKRIPREALSFEGLQGRSEQLMVATAGGMLAARNPGVDSEFYSIKDHYGQARAEKDARKRKQQEEAATLRRLEIKRAGWDGQERLLEIAERRQAKELEFSQLQERPQSRSQACEVGDAEAEGDLLPADIELPSNSVGALAIAEAQRTLQERKEKKRKRDEEEQLRRSKITKLKNAVRNPGTNDRMLVFGSDSASSDDEMSRNPKGAARFTLTREESQSSQPAIASASGGRVSVTRPSISSGRSTGRYTAEEIKNIGFDPLSDPRARETRKRRLAQGEEQSSIRGSALLARHKAPPGTLATPTLKLKKSTLMPNVRAPLPAALSFAPNQVRSDKAPSKTHHAAKESDLEGMERSQRQEHADFADLGSDGDSELEIV